MPDATCPNCSTETSKFELSIQKGMFYNARIALKLPTRRKEGLPETINIQRKENGIIIKSDEPAAFAPAMAIFPVYTPPQPSITAQGNEEEWLMAKRVDNILIGTKLIQVAGTPWERLKKIWHNNILIFEGTWNVGDFERFITKIAYCTALYSLPDLKIVNDSVVDIILGKRADYARFLGCDAIERIGICSELHYVRLEVIDEYLHVWVRLFAPFPVPEYHTIVGKLASGTTIESLKIRDSFEIQNG